MDQTRWAYNLSLGVWSQRVGIGASPLIRPETALRLGRVGTGAVAALVLVSVVFRFLWLDRLPGINGDEAWYGVQVRNFLEGSPWSGRTPSGLPINPLLFLTEAALLEGLGPSFWVLRLPIALWACVGLVLTYVLHRWVFHDGAEALLTVLLLACWPAHLAYSRICWDTSFAFVSVPLVLYSVLRVVERQDVARAATLFACGTVLTLWIHITGAVFVGACLLVILCEYGRELWLWAGRHVSQRTTMLIAGGAVAVIVVLRGPRLLMAALLFSPSAAFDRSMVALSDLAVVGDVLAGPRVYEYLAGVPHPAWTRWAYTIALAAAALGSYVVLCRGGRCDRGLVLLAAFVVALLLLVAERLWLRELSFERYLLYLVPLAAVLVVRVLRACPWRGHPAGERWMTGLTVAMAFGFLWQFWANYFEPLRFQTYETNLHDTWKTGPREPKAAAAEMIERLIAGGGAGPIFAEDWWVLYPLEYLLGDRYQVRSGPVVFHGSARVFVVGFAGSAYLDDARARGQKAGWSIEEREIVGPQGRPILILLVFQEQARSSASDA